MVGVVETPAILAAGFWAGMINVVVGSGTLVTFPTLLLFGYPPLVANVSNNIGLVGGRHRRWRGRCAVRPSAAALADAGADRRGGGCGDRAHALLHLRCDPAVLYDNHTSRRGDAIVDMTAVVTGAARGIGRDVVTRLRAAGYRVVAVDVSPLVAELAEDGWVVPMTADVSADATAGAAIELAVAEFGRLDVLVNNAGRFLRRPILDTTDEDFDALFAINVRPVFRFSRAALPHLIGTRGCIVNTASISGLIGVANQSVYAMTKGAIVQLTRQLAIECAALGVRVNAVAPGAVDTGFMAEARAADPDPAASLAVTLANHPIGRMSAPDEVARAIVFLAAPESAGITGTILSVDGGYVAR
ncbi:SDR family NAD(P)-dependent oxidoreductase [Actinoplanes auranticolor]|nr:SDR family oxidoreductase [Actinoplanes auranticolor]